MATSRVPARGALRFEELRHELQLRRVHNETAPPRHGRAERPGSGASPANLLCPICLRKLSAGVCGSPRVPRRLPSAPPS